MTRAAACDVAYACLAVGGYHLADTDLIFLDQICAERILIVKWFAVHRDCVARCGRLIPHVEYLIAWPEVLPGIAMAAQAPLHLQTLLLIHQGHLVNRTVAGIATHSFIDMNAVIEKDEIR